MIHSWKDYADYRKKEQHTVTGTVKVLERLRSPQLRNSRDILVYLPPSYTRGTKHYPVIYMHDGQNLFDERTSFCGEWRVDETMDALSAHGVEAIVVGIPNSGSRRLDEYSPFRDWRRGGGYGDHYLCFLIDTVKPRVDNDFRTLPDRSHTSIIGSSMGGLISLYAFFRYPEVFGSVGAMSPSIWFANQAVVSFVQRASFVPGTIYLDTGTAEGSFMVADARRMLMILQQKRYRLDHNLCYHEAVGAHHSEAAWGQRLAPALHFLLRYTTQAGRPSHADTHWLHRPTLPNGV